MTAVVTRVPSLFGTGLVARRVDGAAMRTVDGVLDALAEAWDFPPHFGFNRDALDDCMRDLPRDLFTADGRRASGWLTVVENAGRLLADQPDELAWFAESVDFWRESYRDRRFAILLVDDDPERVRESWASTGAHLVEPTEEL